MMRFRERMLRPVLILHLIKLAVGLNQIGLDGVHHYIGYSVLRIIPTTPEELTVLKSLAVDENNQLDFWKGPTEINQPVDVMVPPEKLVDFRQLLLSHGIPSAVTMNDVESYILKERLDMDAEAFTGRDGNPFFARYHGLNEIHSFLDDLGQANSPIASVFSIGKSTENNDLKVIKVGSKRNTSKPIIWIDGGTHAREWISPATVVYIANKLIEDYDSDTQVKNLVDSFDWYFLPVLNPDGYHYSRNTNRMWRKSRRTSPEARWGCRGIDLNRNWGFHWNEAGSSRHPCSETYAGHEPFSEVETRTVSDFILKNKNDMVAYISVHAYSQLWLTPWGWTHELPKDYSSMVTVAQEAADALSKVYGTHYRIGSSTNILYAASGGADDWAYGTAGIKYSYTLELRDTGRYGFLLPQEQIIPTGQETFVGITTMAKAILRSL